MSILIEPKKQLPKDRQLFDNAALRALALPVVIEQFLSLLVGVADTFMVSYAGDAAISGVSLVDQMNNLFVLVFSAIAAGGAVVISQYIGSGRRDSADLSASQLLASVTVIAGVIMAVVLIFGKALFGFLFGNVEAQVEASGLEYMRILAYSYVPLAVYNACAGLYRSMGKTRQTMYVSLASNVLNIGGNAIGIFVLHAGVAGVAWPSFISRTIAALIMLRAASNSRNQVSLRPKFIFRFDPRMVRRIFRIALPYSVEYGLFQLTKIVVVSIVALYGTVQIAANGVAQSIWALSAMFNLAMGPVFITVIGRYMGAGDAEGADYYMRKLLRISILWANIWNFAFLGISFGLLQVYDLSPEAVQLTIILIVMHNILNGTICAFSFAMASGLRAAGDAKYTMISTIVSSVVTRGVLSFLFGYVFGWGVIGTAAAMILDWTVKAVMIWARYKSGKWKGLKVI